MSIASEVNRINQNIASTYTELESLGASIPATKNSANLAATAGTVKAVLYSAQSLTEDQQAQARQNIGADALIGTTGEITPTQVAEAVAEGRDVVIMHASSEMGTMIGNSFYISREVGFVISASIFIFYGEVILGQLMGSLQNDTWYYDTNTIAKASDIPTIPTALKNPYALTFTGAVSGTYDGSSAKTINIPVVDEESIVQQVIAALGTPVFGSVDADNNIILSGNLVDGTYTVKYEDADGNTTTIGTLNASGAPAYTNILKESIGSDGNPYNGGKGWKADTRLNSSGAETSATGTEVTGFMPFTVGDMLRFKDIKITANEPNTTQYIVFYTSSFAKVKHIYTNNLYDHSGQTAKFTLTSDGYWASYDTSNIRSCDTTVDWDAVKYFRISAEEITDESIITRNQAIT